MMTAFYFFRRCSARALVAGMFLFLLGLVGTGRLSAQDNLPRVRAVHIVPDAPPVDVYLDDITPASISNVGYLTASTALNLPAGTHNIKIAATGAPKEAAVINQNIGLNTDTAYTIFATGRLSALNVQPVILSRWLGLAPGPGRSLLRVMNGSLEVGEMNVTIIDVIGQETPLSGIMFRSATDYAAVPEGPIEIVVRDREGEELYRGAGNIGQGALITVVAVGDPSAGTFKLNVLFDSDETARAPMDTLRAVTSNPIGLLRMVNVSPDAGTVDIYVDDQTDESGRIGFREATGAGDVPAQLYNIKVVRQGQGVGDALLSDDVEVLADLYRAAYVIGNVSDQTLELLVLTADASAEPAAGKSTLRLLNAVPDIGIVNVEITFSDASKRQIELSGFRNFTPYESAPPGTATVHVTAVDATETILAATGTIPADVAGTLVLTGTIAGGNLGVNLLVDNDGEPQKPMIAFDVLTGVELERDGLTAMEVVPNPADDYATLRFRLERPVAVNYALYAMTGEKLSGADLGKAEAGEHTFSLDLETLAAGSYLVVLQNGSGQTIGAKKIEVR